MRVIWVLSVFALGFAGCAGTESVSSNGSAYQSGYSESRVVQSRVDPATNPGPFLYTTGIMGGAIAGFDLNSNGNFPPTILIRGPRTNFLPELGLAISLSGERYAVGVTSNGNAWGIGVFGPNANGNVPAKRVITCGGMQSPTAVAVSPLGRMFVVDVGSPFDGSIDVIPAGANGCVSGNPTIAGSSTGLLFPNGIALGQHGDIFVANTGSGSIEAFARMANGDASPIRVISGVHTHIREPYAVATDASGFVYVADIADDSILVFRPQANGDATPIRRIHGTQTGLYEPFSVCVSRDGRIYVSSYGNSAINVYSSTANGNAAPIQQIDGPNTGLNSGAYLGTNP